MTTDIVSLVGAEASARTLVVLDVDWWIEEFKVKTAHTGRGPHERNSTVSYQLPGHQVSITRDRLLGLQVCFSLFLLVPSITFALSLLLAPSLLIEVTQTWGHIAGPPPPSPLRYAPSFFFATRLQHFLSLVHSRRIALTHTMKRSRQLASREDLALSSLVDSCRTVSTHAMKRSRQLVPLENKKVCTYRFLQPPIPTSRVIHCQGRNGVSELLLT